MSDKPKISPDFRAYLRSELLKQQDRRADHVKSKFTFVIALSGLVTTLQSVKLKDPLALNLIIYAIPLVATLFDLYILGGEFAVKRIRSFLILEDQEHSSEKLWTTFLNTWPKDFMRRNRSITTGFIDLACAGVATGNLVLFHSTKYQWMLFAAWLVVVVWLNLYLLGVEKRIQRSFAQATESKRKTAPHE